MQIHLQAAIVKEDSVSRQSSIDLFGCGYIYLQVHIDSSLLLVEQVEAVQLPHALPYVHL